MAGTTQLTAEEVSRQLTGLTEALRRAEEAHRGLQEQLAQSQHRTQLLEQQLLELQQAGSTAAGGTAASRAAAAAAVGSVSPQGLLGLAAPLKGVDLLKQAIKPPKPLKGVEDWERFVWQVETFAALVDESFPVHLEEARKSQSDNTPTEESDEYRALSVKLFGMLVSLIAECPAALKIARGTRNQNGFVLWRMLWRELHPEQANRGLIWRRALLSPKFPNKEGDFSAALQEWELDLAKYESEFGAEKAISDEDKRALLMVESPQALKQHLAMHASSLGSYDEVRAVVVSYLQAKRVWTPSGGYAQSSRRAAPDPDAMDIGKVGDAKGDKGKGKEHYKWVDKVKDGVCKSRFTCADTRRSYTPEMEQDMRVFVPTPTPEAHALLEITALQRGCAMRTFDIVAAFLIGKDRGAQNENWVYMRPPAEWKPIFDQWVREQPPSEQSKLRGQFADMLFRLDGNLYGRRTAGSVYRDELEELLCHKLSQTGRYAFKRGVKDPCIYRCMKTGIIVVHHIDDGRCAGNAALLNTFLDEDMCSHCEITTGPLEAEGVSVEVLGKTKTRLEGCILTAPDAKHARNIIEALGLKPGEKSPVPSRKPDLSDVTPLSAGDAAKYRSAVGSGIYLSADRRDIQYAVKELARHMAEPRQCDMQQARLLGKYLQQAPDLVRVTALDPSAYEGPMTLDVFSDSDWGGCVETRRSTDCHVVVLGGAIVATSTQTQPGLPATSSPDAELRGISRACREAIFVHELATMDFGLEVEIPRLWSDSSTGITAAKRIGPGTKLRHLDVSEFYVQGAVQAGKALLRKVKGTENPANFLTKHPKSGNEVLQALPSLGMVDPKHVAGATAQEKHTVKFVRVNPPTSWKPVFPFKPTLAIAGITMASQILGVKAQPREKELLELVLDVTLWLGLLGWFVLLYHMVKGTVRGTLAICRRVNRHRQHEEEPEPEASEDEAPTQAAENAPPPLEDLFREGVRAPPPRDLRPPAPEPEPPEVDQQAAASALPPQSAQGDQQRRARRRTRPQVPQREPGEIYYAPCRRTAHVFRNCSGLSSTQQQDIVVEQFCAYCL